MRTLRGISSMVILSLNTVVGVSFLLPLALVKLLVPFTVVRKMLDRTLNTVAERWIRNNDVFMGSVELDASGLEALSRKRWYLVEANHQSWADIFVLQKLLTGRIPFLKFFLKRELIWVPFAGAAWWALDYPFMKRHTQEFLRKHPERRGDDLVAIRRACEKFSLIPTAVMNFIEGTRFTTAKHEAQGAPYRHLLAPKAGGLALALDAMGERFHSLLDITIFYPEGVPTFFEMLSGKMKKVVIRMRELPIPSDLIGGNYAADPEFRRGVHRWVGDLWREKDELLDQLIAEYRTATAGTTAAAQESI